MTEAQSSPDTQHSGNAAWQERKEAAIARGQGNVHAIYVDRASGADVWDVEGKHYVDFATGIAVCNTGHLHPQVMTAVQRQLERFSHTCVMVNPYDSAVELAEALNDIVPGDAEKKSLFVTTGAEAVENAIKIARAHTGRRGVIAFSGAFHGRTMMAMGLTGKVAPYKSAFGPFPGDIYRAKYPIEYHDVTVVDALASIESLFRTDVAASDVAAIIVEPVQGEGGFYAAPDDFLQGLRDICDEHGIVLVFDEIQTGFCRTGRTFACEYSGVVPDLVTIAKGMAGGFPLAAVVGNADVMDAPAPGGLGGTYGGSPVGCSAALAVIDVMQSEDLASSAIRIANTFARRLDELQSRHPHIVGDIRCDRGAMIAMELVHNGDHQQPNADLTKKLLASAAENGLLLLSCGTSGNVIRFLPPLVISDRQIDEGLDIFGRCFDAAVRSIQE